MNRINHIFERSAQSGVKALMPFITAGDPDLARSMRLLPAIEAAGGSICEIGIPFSDPIADGPVIQQSMTRALDHGVRVPAIFDAVSQVRADSSLGLVGMVSYSIVHRHGLEAFVQSASRAGFDGLLFPDLPVEQAENIRPVIDEAGLVLVNLVAPSTSIDRAKRIAAASSGFVYVLAQAGITGEREQLPEHLAERVAALREVTDLPIAVGFGISKPDHVREVLRVAEGAIVGSALVRRIAEHQEEDADTLAEKVGEFIGELAAGLTDRSAAVGGF